MLELPWKDGSPATGAPRWPRLSPVARALHHVPADGHLQRQGIPGDLQLIILTHGSPALPPPPGTGRSARGRT